MFFFSNVATQRFCVCLVYFFFPFILVFVAVLVWFVLCFFCFGICWFVGLFVDVFWYLVFVM